MLIIVQHPPPPKKTNKKNPQYQSPTRRVRLPDNLMLVI